LRGGKTKLAYCLGKILIKQGIVKGAIANIPTKLPLPPEWWFVFDALVLYDEAWQNLDNRSSMSNPREYSSWAGKTRSIWLYPSVIALDKRVSYLWCEPVGRIHVPGLSTLVLMLRQVPIVSSIVQLTPLDWFGDTVIRFKWGLEMGENRSDSGSFLMIYPDGVNWEYASFWAPQDDGGISDALARTIAVLEAEQNSGLERYLDATYERLGDLSGYERAIAESATNITKVRNTGSKLRGNTGGSAD
jgi:hypothetical protein